MPKNEDGEFELVVGNKQLLSIVFVMMVLFGIVFSMGYFVGRNSTPEGAPGTAAGQARPGVAQPAAEPGQPAPAPQQQTAAAETPLEPGEAKVAPAGTTPVAAPQTEPVQTAPEAAAEAKPAAEPPPKPVENPKPAPADVPAPGQTFLQVMAVKRSEAELIVEALKKKGFPALVAPVVPGQPEDALWRVLVGPFKDASALAKARADLQAAGFRRDLIVRKY